MMIWRFDGNPSSKIHMEAMFKSWKSTMSSSDGTKETLAATPIQAKMPGGSWCQTYRRWCFWSCRMTFSNNTFRYAGLCHSTRNASRPSNLYQQYKRHSRQGIHRSGAQHKSHPHNQCFAGCCMRLGLVGSALGQVLSRCILNIAAIVRVTALFTSSSGTLPALN